MKKIKHYIKKISKYLFIILLAIFVKSFIVEAYIVSSPSMSPTLPTGDLIVVNKILFISRILRNLPFTNQNMQNSFLKGASIAERGDILLFNPPDFYQGETGKWAGTFVKRCVGLPGDIVEIKNGVIFINGSQNIKTQSEFYSENQDSTNLILRIPKIGDTLNLSIETSFMYQDIIRDEGYSFKISKDSTTFIDEKRCSTYIVKNNYYFMLGDNRKESVDSRIWGFVPEDHIIGQVELVLSSFSSPRKNWYDLIKVRRIQNPT